MNHPFILWEETVWPGAGWSHALKRGTALRIADIEGGANVGALFHNFECPVERDNMPDSLKARHIARLTTGFVLFSDMARILCSVVEDIVGWHDPIPTKPWRWARAWWRRKARAVRGRFGFARFRGRVTKRICRG
jgi:hypothetical protein